MEVFETGNDFKSCIWDDEQDGVDIFQSSISSGNSDLDDIDFALDNFAPNGLSLKNSNIENDILDLSLKLEDYTKDLDLVLYNDVNIGSKAESVNDLLLNVTTNSINSVGANIEIVDLDSDDMNILPITPIIDPKIKKSKFPHIIPNPPLSNVSHIPPKTLHFGKPQQVVTSSKIFNDEHVIHSKRNLCNENLFLNTNGITMNNLNKKLIYQDSPIFNVSETSKAILTSANVRANNVIIASDKIKSNIPSIHSHIKSISKNNWKDKIEFDNSKQNFANEKTKNNFYDSKDGIIDNKILSLDAWGKLVKEEPVYATKDDYIAQNILGESFCSKTYRVPVAASRPINNTNDQINEASINFYNLQQSLNAGAFKSKVDYTDWRSVLSDREHHQMLLTKYISPQPKINNTLSGPVILTDEEKRTLIAEGYSIPKRYPLNKMEEKSLKKIRRKIKNKISAQESRRKKKEYIEALESKLQAYATDNNALKTKVRHLESNNTTLQNQLNKLTSLAKSLYKSVSTQTNASSCFVILFSFLVAAGLNFMPFNNEKASENAEDVQATYQPVKQSRMLLWKSCDNYNYFNVPPTSNGNECVDTSEDGNNVGGGGGGGVVDPSIANAFSEFIVKLTKGKDNMMGVGVGPDTTNVMDTIKSHLNTFVHEDDIKPPDKKDFAFADENKPIKIDEQFLNDLLKDYNNLSASPSSGVSSYSSISTGIEQEGHEEINLNLLKDLDFDVLNEIDGELSVGNVDEEYFIDKTHFPSMDEDEKEILRFERYQQFYNNNREASAMPNIITFNAAAGSPSRILNDDVNNLGKRKIENLVMSNGYAAGDDNKLGTTNIINDVDVMAAVPSKKIKFINNNAMASS